MWTMPLSVVLLLAVSLACAAPLFEVSSVVKKPRGTYGYRGIMGDFIRLTDGALMLSYTDGDIMAVASTDQGRSWGSPRMLVKRPSPPARGSIAHPSFLRLDSGDIMLTYIYTTHPTTPYYGHNYYRLSADEGQTWSDQYCFTPYPGYLPAHNDRLQRLSTGRLLMMAEYKAHLPSSDDHSGYVGMSFFSDDGGYSWQPSRNTVDAFKDGARVEVQEADAVELSDGRLLMFSRTYSGYPIFAYSEDMGQSWGPPIPRHDIPMPYAAMPTVRRLPTGDLLFIWISEKSQDTQDPKVWRRCTLSAAISKDEGETLINRRTIVTDPEGDFGYQCVEFLDDQTVLIAYHTREGIDLARVGVDWFYAE